MSSESFWTSVRVGAGMRDGEAYNERRGNGRRRSLDPRAVAPRAHLKHLVPTMSIREAMRRFRELHEEFKGGAFKSPEARTFYETERDEFLRAFLQAQQLALRPGLSPRQALRVASAVSLALQFGPRSESATTLDLATAGFAAVVSSPLALRLACDFQLGIPGEPVRGRARVVSCTRDGTGAYRTSFAIETMSNEDRARLEVAVIDVALGAVPKR
jgi:hypothetical protein